MSRRVRSKTRPVLPIRTEVFSKHGPDGDHGGEDTRGADGKPVYPGRMVKVPEHYSDELGHMVPERFGTVVLMYRQDGVKCKKTGCDIVVEALERGVRYFWLDTVVRCARQTDETKADKAEAAAKLLEATKEVTTV